jgi:hypothetical protein
MELTLFRDYHPEGTNGELFHLNELVCYTIELPWLHNQLRISCIPEGRYRLRRRSSKKFGQHLLVEEVPGRSLILVHPANDAARELKGCLAPVSQLAGAGKGSGSRRALKKLLALTQQAEKEQPIYLTIKSKQHEHHKPHTGTHA